MIKNIVYDNAFIEYNVSQFFFIDNYLAYIITFFIHFIYLRHFIIKRIFHNLNVEFDIIEIQSIQNENNLMLLF